MMKYNLKITLLLLYGFCQGQTKQNCVWKFGDTGAGLEFNNCTSLVLTNGISNGVPFEGQSAISDGKTGRLLFYTDGYNIYDSTNSIMHNGGGAGLNNSLTQTIIIKKPGSNSLFYMVTPDMQGGLVYNGNYPNSRGVNYAVVDMSLNNGLGSVVSTFNSLKDTSNCEKLTAVYHSNGNDIWLIGHEYGNNNFFSFLITNSGINTVPIISSVGPVIYTWQGGSPGISNLDAIGELRASPNGNRIAFTCYFNGTTSLFDFNKTTGRVSNPIPLTIEAGGYGVSFSPDNSKLYISGVDTSTVSPSYPTNGKIYQFDVSSNNQTVIQNTRTTIFVDSIGMFRSLKLGRDGKIYVARGNGVNYLGVINAPDNSGISCSYYHNGIYLNELQGRWGLNNAIEDSVFCIETDISDVAVQYDAEVYPNPFTKYIVFSLTNNEQSTVSLFNFLGQQVLQYTFAKSTTINMEQFAGGMYFYELRSSDGIIETGKIVKQ